MSFEQGQTVTFTTDWGADYEATILSVLPDDAKYGYAVEYVDEDGDTNADFADEDDLRPLIKKLTLDEEQLQDLRGILRVATGDHRDKYGQDCSCLTKINTYLELVETALRGEA